MGRGVVVVVVVVVVVFVVVGGGLVVVVVVVGFGCDTLRTTCKSETKRRILLERLIWTHQ